METKHRIRRLAMLMVMGSFLAGVLLPGAVPSARAAGGWTTSGTQILNPAGGSFAIAGINWYGFETRDNVAHGMWAKHYKAILDQVKQYGYNTVRLPFSNAMWETNPIPSSSKLSACAECKGKRARDIMALIVNYAGAIGLHVIPVNHRSTAGNSAQENGLWYTSGYLEQAWIRDWVSVQQWAHGIPQTLGGADTVTVNDLAADGFPIILGYDLRNEPHTPSRTKYLDAATWGTGDGVDPQSNPNPNPFVPTCVASSTCHDWRLAAERAGTTLLGEAAKNGWSYPLIIVEGIGQYPTLSGTAANGPYDGYWWGGSLLGVNGNAGNPGAPILLNAGGSATRLGAAVPNQVVYSAHEYGPALFQQSWFNTATCYRSGCSASSLADVWTKNWAHLARPGGINPVWPGHASYPWANTGHTAYTEAPVYIGEFGTANADTDLYSSGAGTQGQWFTALVNFIQSSHTLTTSNDSGVPVSHLHYTYWALNDEDSYALLGASYTGLENPKKEYSFLCFIQQAPFAVPRGTGTGQCGSTGVLPAPQ
jgi:endoglucanase